MGAQFNRFFLTGRLQGGEQEHCFGSIGFRVTRAANQTGLQRILFRILLQRSYRVFCR